MSRDQQHLVDSKSGDNESAVPVRDMSSRFNVVFAIAVGIAAAIGLLIIAFQDRFNGGASAMLLVTAAWTLIGWFGWCVIKALARRMKK